MIHATYDTPEGKAGNAAVDAQLHNTTGIEAHVSLTVHELQDTTGPEATALLTISEAEAIAAMLRAAIAEEATR